MTLTSKPSCSRSSAARHRRLSQATTAPTPHRGEDNITYRQGLGAPNAERARRVDTLTVEASTRASPPAIRPVASYKIECYFSFLDHRANPRGTMTELAKFEGEVRMQNGLEAGLDMDQIMELKVKGAVL
jgi:hypothetical protein